MSLKRKILKDVIEPLITTTWGRHVWAPVSVSVLAYGENDDVLVLESDGNYELPGGLIQGGDTLKEAGKREVNEETGCEVELGQLLEISTEKGRFPGVHFFFEAEVKDADLEGSWEGNPEFVPKDEVKDLEWKLHHSHVHEYLFPEE